MLRCRLNVSTPKCEYVCHVSTHIYECVFASALRTMLQMYVCLSAATDVCFQRLRKGLANCCNREFSVSTERSLRCF